MLPIQHTIPTPYPVGPVHCYSTEIQDQLILIDTGPPTAEGKHYLQQNLDLKRLKALLITHCHIDHYGLAGWLQREYGCTVYLPYRDSLKINKHAERLDGMAEVLTEIGFDKHFLNEFRQGFDSDLVFPDFPEQFKIAEQHLPAEFGIEVIPCPGHSQSDLVYTTNSWAITGDTMLREIFQSPLLDVDLLTGKRFRNYAAYCQTITQLATLRDKKILPGHRNSIVGVNHNICYYTSKIFERASRSRKLTAELSPPQVVERLFGDSAADPFLKYLKTSEIVFIRDFLADSDRLKRSLKQIGLFARLEKPFNQATGAC